MSKYIPPKIIEKLCGENQSVVHWVSQLAVCEAMIPVKEDQAITAPRIISAHIDEALMKELSVTDAKRVAAFNEAKRLEEESCDDCDESVSPVTGTPAPMWGGGKEAKRSKKKRKKNEEPVTSPRAIYTNAGTDRSMLITYVSESTCSVILSYDDVGSIARRYANSYGSRSIVADVFLSELSDPYAFATSSVRSSSTGGRTDVFLGKEKYARSISRCSYSLANSKKLIDNLKSTHEHGVLLLRQRNAKTSMFRNNRIARELADVIFKLRDNTIDCPTELYAPLNARSIGIIRKDYVVGGTVANTAGTPIRLVSTELLHRYILRLVQVGDVIEHGEEQPDVIGRATDLLERLLIGWTPEYEDESRKRVRREPKQEEDVDPAVAMDIVEKFKTYTTDRMSIESLIKRLHEEWDINVDEAYIKASVALFPDEVTIDGSDVVYLDDHVEVSDIQDEVYKEFTSNPPNKPGTPVGIPVDTLSKRLSVPKRVLLEFIENDNREHVALYKGSVYVKSFGKGTKAFVYIDDYKSMWEHEINEPSVL